MIASYDANKIEENILAFWEKNRIYDLVKQKNKKGKDFYFLDGPPYTSGKLHIGHAWNYSMKDMMLRFKRMSGFDVWDRPGYDTHGLPTAHAIEKKFGIKNKDEIPKFGVAKFVSECRKLCQQNLEAMKKDQIRLGVWMNFDDPYITFKNEFIEGEWWLIKKAHENKRLYEGEKVMPWCAKCATTLAKHELEYKNVTDNSIFLKFKIKNKEEYLVIWTTTPWTIPFNLAVMVNPELDYVKCKVGDEKWILAKQLAAPIIANFTDSKYEVIEEFKGKELEGAEYTHPFYDELKDVYDKQKQISPKAHTVILSKEYVDTSAGSGLVHCAPGCGPEDYEAGYQYKILPFNNLNESGVFPEEMGKFKGLTAKKDDPKFIKELKEKGALISESQVEHEYPHCWRCKNPVIFRTTKQWFFKIEDIKEKMRELNKKIKWQPDWAGNKQFDSWLDNLRDNSITRQRYWGCPAPIWRCECGEYKVIGSLDELKKLSGKVPEDLHIPYIDGVEIPCPKCGQPMKRIPDILDVWVDAGTTSWNSLNYPQNKELFKKLWPADFILEGKDQIRGWFNLLFVASMVSMNKPSYKSVYMHGFVNDAQGRKMSKSLQNYILPNEVIDKYGSDTLRYYSIGGANPGLDMNYNFEDIKLKYRNLVVLWNLHKLVIDLSNTLNKKPSHSLNNQIEEKYISSKLNTTIEKVTNLFEEHKLNEAPLLIEDLFLELSRTYIQIVRDKSSSGTKQEKQTVLNTLYTVLLESLKLFAPVAPFITEAIYQNLKQEFGLKQESIHLLDWPKPDKKLIDKELEQDMETAKNVIQSILSIRDKIQTGVRWPLKEAIIETKDKTAAKAIERLSEIIKTMTAVKEIRIIEELSGLKTTVKSDYNKLAPVFKQLTPKIIAALAMDSKETILAHLEKDGAHTITVDGKKIEVTKDYLIISKELPKNLEGAEFRYGSVYVDKKLTPELEAEGYSRELMRKIQSLRKKAGLEKKDKIILFVKPDEDLVDGLNKHSAAIKERVGADKLKISTESPVKKLQHHSKEKIKFYSFEIWFDKI